MNIVWLIHSVNTYYYWWRNWSSTVTQMLYLCGLFALTRLVWVPVNRKKEFCWHWNAGSWVNLFYTLLSVSKPQNWAFCSQHLLRQPWRMCSDRNAAKLQIWKRVRVFAKLQVSRASLRMSYHKLSFPSWLCILKFNKCNWHIIMFAGKVGDVYSASNAREIRKRKKQQKQHPICLTENLHSKWLWIT